jgi:HPt (histidine-containing phosphotransfer) domain-containing protein
VHRWKGVAANLGAVALAQALAALEGALPRGDALAIAALQAEVDAAWALTRDAWRARLGASAPVDPPAGTPAAPELAPLVERLRAAAAACDPGALDLAHAGRGALAAAWGPDRADALVRALESFDFDAAVGLIGAERRGGARG